ncbi:MAG: SPOR domain-containing protein [Bacteroidales bacterium]|nr:SPOR domain-containing protein [Bacteroidales bacterium]
MSHLKSILLLLLFALPFAARAQEETYTDQLKQKGTDGATVVVHQDAELEELINAGGRDVRDSVKVQNKKPAKTSGPHTKDNGYRVQIFMAGNTAQDKATVKSMARRFKTHFPAVNAYVYFTAPHWICTTGDFKTQQEAGVLLKQVRAAGFNSACVVRTKVNVFQQQ